jgi:hypothetical protein
VGVLHLGQVGAGDGVLHLGVGHDALGSLVRGGCKRLSLRCKEGLPALHAYAREFSQSATRLAWSGAPDPYDPGDGEALLRADRLAEVGILVTYALVTASRQYHY